MNNQSQIQYYFHLQYLRLFRALDKNGVYPWLFFPLALIVFVALTIKLLSNYSYGEYIYAMLALGMLTSTTNRARFEFLQQISDSKQYYLIRLAEQFLVLIPFIVALLFYHWFWPALILVLAGVFLGLNKFRYNFPISLPTPFGRSPFEFPSGFRKSIPLILLSYILVPIGISVGNINLALASLVAIGFIASGFYYQPEPRYYIWVHQMNPDSFLKEKIKVIFRNTIILQLPILLALMVCAPQVYLKIIILVLAAICFVIVSMLSKYLSYPQEINVIHGMAMLFSILLPPIMLFIIPWFYIKAKRRLNTILR